MSVSDKSSDIKSGQTGVGSAGDVKKDQENKSVVTKAKKLQDHIRHLSNLAEMIKKSTPMSLMNVALLMSVTNELKSVISDAQSLLATNSGLNDLSNAIKEGITTSKSSEEVISKAAPLNNMIPNADERSRAEEQIKSWLKTNDEMHIITESWNKMIKEDAPFFDRLKNFITLSKNDNTISELVTLGQNSPGALFDKLAKSVAYSVYTNVIVKKHVAIRNEFAFRMLENVKFHPEFANPKFSDLADNEKIERIQEFVNDVPDMYKHDLLTNKLVSDSNKLKEMDEQIQSDKKYQQEVEEEVKKIDNVAKVIASQHAEDNRYERLAKGASGVTIIDIAKFEQEIAQDSPIISDIELSEYKEERKNDKRNVDLEVISVAKLKIEIYAEMKMIHSLDGVDLDKPEEVSTYLQACKQNSEYKNILLSDSVLSDPQLEEMLCDMAKLAADGRAIKPPPYGIEVEEIKTVLDEFTSKYQGPPPSYAQATKLDSGLGPPPPYESLPGLKR